MNLDEIQLRQLFVEMAFVLSSDENNQLSVNAEIVLADSEEGGKHRVCLMDALRSAVNGQDIVTPEDKVKSAPWYSDTDEFVTVAAMAVGQFNRN